MTTLILAGLGIVLLCGVALIALKIVLVLILWVASVLGAAWRGQL